MDAGTVFLIIVLVIIVIVLGVGVTLAVLVSKGVLGLVRMGKPKYEIAKRNALKVRAETATGPSGELLRLRVRLQESLEATARSLAVAEQTHQYTGNLPGILRTIQQAGGVLENQLLVAQKDPDPTIQNAYVKTLGAQVEQVTHTATGIRNALAQAASPVTDSELKDVTRTLEVEATMLKNWSKTYTDLGE